LLAGCLATCLTLRQGPEMHIPRGSLNPAACCASKDHQKHFLACLLAPPADRSCIRTKSGQIFWLAPCCIAISCRLAEPGAPVSAGAICPSPHHI
jgi:hypothetical protein